MDGTLRIAAGSIGVGALVLALKTAAWLATGSAALLSDALESVVNVAAAGMAFAALRFAGRPPDDNHPFGHAKVEFFAAVVEGVLIVLAAVAILFEAWRAWRMPAPIEASALGFTANALATVCNAAWATVLLRRGRAIRSPTLRADGRHLVGDVVTSVGVLGGVGLALATDRPWLDPLLAAATAAYILGSGLFVIRDSVGGLMDAAPAPDVVARIRAVVGQHAEGAIEAHDLRSRHAGRTTFVEFHLVVPGDMTVAAAHEICDHIEAALRADMEGIAVTIHVEPEAKAKHQGVLVL